MSSTPAYIGTPKTWTAALGTANTNRDGSGTLATLVTGGASGSRIDSLEITAQGTTTAGVVRFFLYDGTNTRLFKEQLIAAITPSTSVEVARYVLTFLKGLIIPNGWSLKASTNNAENFTVTAGGGDF